MSTPVTPLSPAAPSSPTSAAPELSSEMVARGSKARRGRGFLKATVLFEPDKSSVCFRVYEIRDLKPARGGLPSSYIKCYMLPDPNKKTKRKTSVIANSMNPFWGGEEMRWKIDPEKVCVCVCVCLCVCGRVCVCVFVAALTSRSMIE